MIKVLLFDFSRVLLHPTDSSYTGKLNTLNRAYSGENPLGPYNFWKHFFINEELLDFAQKLKKEKHIKIAMFTTDIIQERIEIKEKIKDIFDNIFTARQLSKEGLTADTLEGIKATKEAFEAISQKLSVTPEEILFIDDTVKNIEAAKKAGCKTIHFAANKKLEEANKGVIQTITLLLGK